MANNVALTEQDLLAFTLILGLCTFILVYKASSVFREKFDATRRLASNAVEWEPQAEPIQPKNPVSVTAISEGQQNESTAYDPSRTVLIVDDDPVTRRQLRRHLEKLKLIVKEVPDGPSAVNLYKEGHRFCMIVMDYEMPDMNGLLTTKKIRSFDNDVVIIGSTIHDPATKQNEFLQAGANFVDIKPISAERLSEFVAEYNIAPASNL